MQSATQKMLPKIYQTTLMDANSVSCQCAAAVTVSTQWSSKYVPLIGRADRQFWSQPWRHQDSDKTLEFLKRSACVKKSMAVWDNDPKPQLSRNQKRVHFRDSPRPHLNRPRCGGPLRAKAWQKLRRSFTPTQQIGLPFVHEGGRPKRRNFGPFL